ncbi:Diphthamide biosynthesis protein 2 [Lambiella insularis]|nr:Diphthamide biosynthesis protein 2 [Lambiella insularis]
MPGLPNTAPVLSTPDTHVFEEPTPAAISVTRRTPKEIFLTYEIERTLSEIRHGKWHRIALQFPDEMLPDAPRVFDALRDGLKTPLPQQRPSNLDRRTTDQVVDEMLDARPSMQDRRDTDQLVDKMLDLQFTSGTETSTEELPEARLYILADTSYGACCVDEIAAEHVDADVVVHYGRACLSPTARLPVIYVFTNQSLPLKPLLGAFRETYPGLEDKIILMADVTYSSHLTAFSNILADCGYSNTFAASIVHDPSSPLPNRTVPDEAKEDSEKLREWKLFHLADPPQSLLLTLSSRLSSIHIYPISQADPSRAHQTLLASTSLALRRRYALITSLSTVPIFGILINTLSVKNYLHIVEHVKAQILAAGKKSYTFVVGKVNAAKIANFSEVGGWVVIGCWESSLVESKDFWKPVITPFELELTLKGDEERVWTGEWRSDFQAILEGGPENGGYTGHKENVSDREEGLSHALDGGELDSEPESAPPEYDLRTGKYISYSRPMSNLEPEPRLITGGVRGTRRPNDGLVKRARGDLAIIGGEASPGADFLSSQRTWKGLGSDFEIAYDEDGVEANTSIEAGRSGIARGYQHRGDLERR